MYTVKAAGRLASTGLSKRVLRSALLAAALSAAGAAHADIFDWAGFYYDPVWTSSAAWINASSGFYHTPSVDPNSDVRFTNLYMDPNLPATNVFINGDQSAYSLTFDTLFQMILMSQYSGSLTIGAGGITFSSSTALPQFNNISLLLGADQTWSFNNISGSTLSLQNGVDTNGHILTLAANNSATNANFYIYGTGGLNKSGAGMVTLGNTNDFTGTTTISEGNLRLTNTYALQNSTVALSSASTGILTFSGSNYVLGGLSGNGNLDISGVQLSVGNNSADTTYSGALSGTGSLIKIGTGTLTLTGANTHTGKTTVINGVLELATGGSLINYGIDVAGGKLLLNGGNVNYLFGRGNSPVLNVGTVAATANLEIQAGTLNSVESNFGTVAGSTAIVTHSGGNFITTNLTFGSAAGSSATYNLSGDGLLSANNAFIGSSTTATFNQTGGQFGSLNLHLGYNAGGVGNYILNGGYNSAFNEFIGSSGSGTFTHYAGTNSAITMTLGWQTGSVGTYNLVGGTLSAGSIAGGSGTSTFNFAGGLLQATQDTTSLLTGITHINVQGGGAFVDTNGHAVTIVGTLHHDTTAGAPANDGGLTKTGAGTLTLAAGADYLGDTLVQSGSLLIQNGALSGNITTYSGTSAELQGVHLTPGFNSLTTWMNSTMTFSTGTTVTGGYMDGYGTYDVGMGGATFTGTTINNGANFVVNNGTANFKNVTSSGTVNVSTSRILNWAGGSNFGGTLNINGLAKTSGWSSNGVINIANGGTLSNAGSNLKLLAGSRTYVGSAGTPGGTLSTTSNTTIELSGLLVNNGAVSGTLNINYGGTAMGAGAFDVVNINTGGVFHPGNSPQIATANASTWNAGGAFDFVITDALGGPGSAGYSQLQLASTLTINAGSTPNTLFTILLKTILPGDTPGLMTSFDAHHDYTWTLVTTGAGITGFDPADFKLDTTGFLNSYDGSFNLSSDGSNLYLNYVGAAVPEPATLTTLALTGILLFRRRK